MDTQTTQITENEELARLRAENERLRALAAATKPVAPGISFKVSEKGAVCVSGLRRFPVTLYKKTVDKALRHGRRDPRVHHGT